MLFTRRHLLAGLAGLALAPLSSACGRTDKPLVVASHIWPGYELMFLAQREGWFPRKAVLSLRPTRPPFPAAS
ncbi:MAG TPA: hypothetical protein VI078_06325 [bacterium]